MHLLESRVYAGIPGETVQVETDVAGGGSVTVTLDNASADEDPTFRLKNTLGGETIMRIALIGAEGESCVVKITEVNGGSDGDLLLCQRLDPAPVHSYRFITTPAAAVTALRGATRSRGVVPMAPAGSRAAGTSGRKSTSKGTRRKAPKTATPKSPKLKTKPSRRKK